MDIKATESCTDSDATVKCGNRIINLRQKLEIMANAIIKKQEKTPRREIPSNEVANSVNRCPAKSPPRKTRKKKINP